MPTAKISTKGQLVIPSRLRKALQHILSYKDRVWMTLPGQVASHYTSLPIEQQLAAK